MIFVDGLRDLGDGKQGARLFTDGPLSNLHHVAEGQRLPRKAFTAPVLIGAQVVGGGYYLVTGSERERLLEAGAVDAGAIPRDVPLAGMLAVAQARARAAG